MIGAVIFDMDGVIIDSEPIHFEVDEATMNDSGVTITKEELDKYVGMTSPEMWAELKVPYDLKQTVEAILDSQLKAKIERINTMTIAPIEGITELLHTLAVHNIQIALASSSAMPFIKAVLTKFNILDYFSVIVSGEEVPQGKPAPDIYIKTAELLHLKSDQCVVIEDSKNGTLAAKSAGMKCIGFCNPNSGNQDLSKADITVDSIKDINLAYLNAL
ncbi:HAD family hydrolase [Cellulosilyticum sp. I15G10I2]|uniref:HAD family hydrolase n=1 Tax=Cellulosilyticum sp. I15G10I2 TaxID=1892843 RepID=UPI00085C1DE4|nr:HAD family hydrolase [Cellulosilyticum sp. I15G10I2]